MEFVMREYMNTLIPHVLERSGNSEVSYDLYSRLLKDRIIFVDGEIVDETADLVVAQILYLESENPEKDINMFNQYGKIEHYNELDRKTQKHIDFGIKRSKAKSKIQLLLICVRYSPRIISYSIYNIARKITGIRDKKYLKKVIIKNTAR